MPLQSFFERYQSIAIDASGFADHAGRQPLAACGNSFQQL
jgi:hypothetical protein